MFLILLHLVVKIHLPRKMLFHVIAFFSEEINWTFSAEMDLIEIATTNAIKRFD